MVTLQLIGGPKDGEMQQVLDEYFDEWIEDHGGVCTLPFLRVYIEPMKTLWARYKVNVGELPTHQIWTDPVKAYWIGNE